MLPEFYDGMYLPEGEHAASWEEVIERFGAGEVRSRHCERLLSFLRQARSCGFVKVYIFGSFISAKERPGDVDLLWIYNAEDFEGLSRECKELINYEVMKRREGWDMFCCSNDQFCISYLLKGWRTDKSPEKKSRGMVILDIQTI